jgi:hypothetical protein
VVEVIKSLNRFTAIAKNTSPVNKRMIGSTIPNPVWPIKLILIPTSAPIEIRIII